MPLVDAGQRHRKHAEFVKLSPAQSSRCGERGGMG
jgi:hypothetical protein